MRSRLSVPAQILLVVLTAPFTYNCSDAHVFGVPGEDGGDDHSTALALALEVTADSMLEEDEARIRAVPLDERGEPLSADAVQWSSSDAATVAIVAEDDGWATLLAGQPGTATVTASYGELQEQFAVTVLTRPADLVLVSGTGQEGAAGSTLADSLVVRVVDRRGDFIQDVRVEFQVLSGGGAVSPSARPTAADGTAATAWTLGGGGAQELRARVVGSDDLLKKMKVTEVLFSAVAVGETPLIDVEVVPGSVAIAVGDTLRLDAVAMDSDGNTVSDPAVSWHSSDSTVASVSSAGLVRALRAGTASAIARLSADDGAASDTATITVDEPPSAPISDVTVSPSVDTLDVGQTVQLSATVLDADGSPVERTLSWSSSDDAVATVDGTGLVTGRGEGGAQITATTDGVSGSAGITVQGTAAGTLTISPAADTLYGVGDTLTLSAEARDADGSLIPDAQVQWTSHDPDIAAVDAMGRVEAKAVGTVLITAASLCCSQDSTAIAVDAPERVTDLEVTNVTAESVTLEWTQVDDGHGEPANYALRYGTPQITADSLFSTQADAVVGGTAIGELASHTYYGLSPATDYQFQVGSFRGEISMNPVWGALSAPTAARTAPGTGDLANECMSPQDAWVWCDDFEQNRLASYFEYSGGGSFARVSAVGIDGSSGMRAHFAQGQVDAGSLKLAFGRTPSASFDPVDAGSRDYREIYWRMYVRYPTTWIGGGGYKLSRVTSFAAADWSQAMIAHVWSDEADHRYLLVDPASGTDSEGNVQTTGYNDFPNLQWLGAARSQTPIFAEPHLGPWHCVESHVRLNSPSMNDGIFQLWINGRLEARVTDLNWVGAYDAYGINALFLENYWNGGAPQEQVRYFDNLVVSTQPIGCEQEPVSALGSISDLEAISGDGQVALSWTPASNATSHRPQHSTDGGSTWTDFGSVLGGSAASVVVTGLTNGLAYDFRVVASDGITTTYSNQQTATPGTAGSFDAFAHEPANAGEWLGYETITRRHFDALDEGGWTDDEYDQGYIDIVAAPSPMPEDNGTGTALRITYPNGWGDGSAPNTSYIGSLGGPRRVYVSASFRYSESFDGWGSPNKLFFLRGSWGNGPFISADGRGSSELEIDVDLQGTSEGSGTVGDANEVSSAARIIEREKWYVIEIIMVRNSSPGTADGTLDIYVGSPADGTAPVHAISVTGIEYGAGSFGSTYTFQISPTYGGNSGKIHSGEGYLYLGHFYVGGV